MAFERKHKWLSVREGVILSPYTEASIKAVRKYFEKAQHQTEVTSGQRSPEHQVWDAILPIARREGIEKLYSEFMPGIVGTWLVNKKVQTAEGLLFWWQRTWSEELWRKYIINPPIDAVCLRNYFRPGSNENMKGKIISGTPHAKDPGSCYDIGGGKDHNPNDEYAILLEAAKDEKCRIKSMTLETTNGAVHVNVLMTPVPKEAPAEPLLADNGLQPQSITKPA